MSKVFLWLLLLLIPIEIMLWRFTSHQLGSGWMVLWGVATFFYGLYLIGGLKKLPHLNVMLNGMQAFPSDFRSHQITSVLTRAFAGLLFLIPGLLTDVLAILLLLPPVQYGVHKLVLNFFLKRQAAMQEVMMNQMRQHGFARGAFTQDGFSPNGGFSGTTVEGEARTVESMPTNNPQIGRQPANDA